MKDKFLYECELQRFITIREGMIAENTQRELRGEALAYNDHAFASIAEDIENLGKEFQDYLNSNLYGHSGHSGYRGYR